MYTPTQTIREIVTSRPSAVGVLQRFDIDLCAQADTPLAQACAQLQLSVGQVHEKLDDAERDAPGNPVFDPESLSIERLIQHIVRVHHQYIRRELPGLTVIAHNLAIARSNRAPKLLEVEKLVAKLRADLCAHIEKEEQLLFPFISQMDQESVIAIPPFHERFRSVAQLVSVMAHEHQSASDIIGELRRLTDGFEPPSWACVTHSALFVGLQAFEADHRQHVHLEDDVLFPRAIQRESELKARGNPWQPFFNSALCPR